MKTKKRPPFGGHVHGRVSLRCSASYTLCRFAAFPSRENKRLGRGKIRHTLLAPLRRFPPLVPDGTTFPPQAGALWVLDNVPHMTQMENVERFYSVPSRGNERYEGKNSESYTSCTIPVCPPLVAVATTLSAGKRVTGFSVAYGSLRIQFPCHPVGSMSYDIEKEIP